MRLTMPKRKQKYRVTNGKERSLKPNFNCKTKSRNKIIKYRPIEGIRLLIDVMYVDVVVVVSEFRQS